MVPNGTQWYPWYPRIFRVIRLLACGRCVAFEMFRTRLDALTASTLFEELYEQKDSIDVYKLLGHFNSSGSDLNEWTVKYDAVQSMCENTLRHTSNNTCPKTPTKPYLIRLKNCVAKMRNLQPSANLRQQPNGPIRESCGYPKPSFAPSPGASPSSASAVPPAPLSSKKTAFDQYRRPKDKPAAFGTQPPEGYGKAKIDAWIRFFFPKNKQSQVERLSRQMMDEYKACGVGDQPNVEAILADWGLTSRILIQAPIENQIRLLTAAQHIKNQ